MTLVARRSRAALAVLVVAALAAALLVVGAAKPSPALNGKVLILDTTLAAGAGVNEATQAEAQGLGVDVVDATQWAGMTTTDFAQYDAIVLGDPECDDAGDAADTLAAPLANLATWVPAVGGNVFVSTFDATYHANNGANEAGATQQITKGLAYAAGGGATGLYFTSSCYDDDAWLGILNAFSAGWTAIDHSADTIHVTGSATLLAGIDDASLSDYDASVHNLFQSWSSDFTVFAIATDSEGDAAGAANQGGASAAVALEGPYEAQDGTSGAPVILLRGTNTSPSHILLQEDQTYEVGQPAHLLATVTDPTPDEEPAEPNAAAFPVDGITVTFTVLSGPNAGKVVQGVTDADGNAAVEYTSAAAGSDVWQASFVGPTELTETSNPATITWQAAAAAPLVVTPRFTG